MLLAVCVSIPHIASPAEAPLIHAVPTGGGGWKLGGKKGREKEGSRQAGNVPFSVWVLTGWMCWVVRTHRAAALPDRLSWLEHRPMRHPKVVVSIPSQSTYQGGGFNL